MQGLTQFNGHYGCNWCLHPRISIKNKKKPKSSTLKYTLLHEKIEMRSSSNMLKFTEESIKSNKAVMGVKNSTVLSHLPGFDILKGFVPNSLHCIFLDVCRQFAKYWFDESKTDYYLGPNNIKTIETILKSIKAPNQVTRLSRSMKDKRYWKSREWENLLLYYSYPILKSMPSFLIDYTLCKKINTSNDGVNKKILSEAGSEETEAILTTLINSVAVYIEIENEKYLTSVPNIYLKNIKSIFLLYL
ncbi:hypothetical protein TKK_0002947 [Trichogramma kaykai]